MATDYRNTSFTTNYNDTQNAQPITGAAGRKEGKGKREAAGEGVGGREGSGGNTSTRHLRLQRAVEVSRGETHVNLGTVRLATVRNSAERYGGGGVDKEEA